MDPSPAAAPPPSAPCWSAVLQKKPPPVAEEPISTRVFGSCKSSKGIAVAVVDASAIIHGDKLAGSADKFVSVPEVLNEVRDPVSRLRLSFLPFPVEPMEPSPDSLKKVIKFARETGDLQTLSSVDLKLIALTYTLESEIHGTGHLRSNPPPLRVVNVKHIREADMPGWGSNVPNLAEWEALEQATEGGAGDGGGSRILPLKDLDENVIAVAGTETDSKLGEGAGEEQDLGRHRRFPKREIKIDGKKMVADGIDASLGENADDGDDWQPAVSRSTHKRYLRRKARREMSEAVEENEDPLEAEKEGENHSDSVDPEVSDPLEEEKEDVISGGNAGFGHGSTGNGNRDDAEGDDIGVCANELDNLEITTQGDGRIDAASVDDDSSEQSWTMRSLSESTVACATSDFAMQNVILQIGLRLLASGGMQIRELNRWVLKCHACNNVTQDIGRMFCPRCGNGGTLRKVSVTVGENGIVLAARKQRIILRGTRFSLPMPQGGREAVTTNPILREDQLPRKMLYPKTKKKANSQDEFSCADDIFTHAGDQRAPLKAPVRKALVMFSGRRNPNDNHFSRRKHY